MQMMTNRRDAQWVWDPDTPHRSAVSANGLNLDYGRSSKCCTISEDTIPTSSAIHCTHCWTRPHQSRHASPSSTYATNVSTSPTTVVLSGTTSSHNSRGSGIEVPFRRFVPEASGHLCGGKWSELSPQVVHRMKEQASCQLGDNPLRPCIRGMRPDPLGGNGVRMLGFIGTLPCTVSTWSRAKLPTRCRTIGGARHQDSCDRRDINPCGKKRLNIITGQGIVE